MRGPHLRAHNQGPCNYPKIFTVAPDIAIRVPLFQPKIKQFRVITLDV